MKKLLKKLTVTGIAVITAMGMTVSASAVCAHNYDHTYYITGPYHTSTTQHMHPKTTYNPSTNSYETIYLDCTITQTYGLIYEICTNCGANVSIHDIQVGAPSHSVS